MRFTRALWVADPQASPGPALDALRVVAPSLQHVLVVAPALPPRRGWLGTSTEPDDESERALDVLRAAAHELTSSVDVDVIAKLDAAALVQLARDARIDLVVIGSRTVRDASLVSEAQKRLGVPILWPSEARGSVRPATRALCIPLGRAGRLSLAAFLREHADRSLRVTLVSPLLPPPDELALAVEILGIRATIERPSVTGSPLRALLSDGAARPELDVLVLTRVPLTLLRGIAWPLPVLVLPPPAALSAARARALDVPDAVDDRGTLRLRVSYEALVGSLTPVESLAIACVSQGAIVATPTTSPYGEVELPSAPELRSLGVLRVDDAAAMAGMPEIEAPLRVLRPGGPPLVVFDSELIEQAPHVLRKAARDAQLLAVRVRPTRNVRAIRERLRELRLPTPVVDARAVLDEGPAFDVSDALDAVRLLRVALRLRRAGFALAGYLPREVREPRPLPSERAPIASGNRVSFELDNALARRWLLSAIAESQRSLCLQVYMVADDELSDAVAGELAHAGARGVAVRVLVDSLHARHGSFGTRNPVLARLAAHPGVELRVARPVQELPSLVDLKQRDHKKLLVADGALALVGGRNLAREYYTAFHEARITASSLWRDVPWLDCGARIEGPAVTVLESVFLQDWVRAGGTPFVLGAAPRAGDCGLRVVVHEGLRDARTLDAYRELIDEARARIDLVSGFPLLLELQHGLLRAHARGVRVRVLTGHPAPTHDAEAFPGPWATARLAATELLHSRLDPLVEAGCEVYALAVSGEPSWDPALGVVHPHVHAKLIAVDGARCAFGSANFDVTASYWESELLVRIDDPELTRDVEAQLERVLAGSTRFLRDDPAWKRLAARRSWMRHWPGVLSV